MPHRRNPKPLRVRHRWIVNQPVRRKDSPWLYARVRDLSTGRVYFRSTGLKRSTAAMDWAVEFVDHLEELEAKGRRPGSSRSIEKAVESWLSTRDLSPSTVAGYRSMSRQWVKSWRSRTVASIVPSEVESYLTKLRENGIGPSMRNRQLIALRAFFGWCARNGHAPSDPTAGIRKLPQSRVEKLAPSTGELRSLLAAVEPQSDLWIAILLASHTGLRRANVMAARWDWIRDGWIWVPAAQMKARKAHSVPLHPELATALEERTRDAETIQVVRRRDHGPQFSRAIEEAGVEKFQWRWMRDYFASRIAESSSWAIVQRLMGHAPEGVTGGYVEPENSTLKTAIQSLPELLCLPNSLGRNT